MVVVTSAAAVLAFAAAFHVSGLVGKALAVVATTRDTMRVIGDSTLDDDAKETQVQRASKLLFVDFAAITLRAIAVLLVPLATIYLADLADLAEFDAVMAFLLSWEFILATCALAAVVIWWSR